MIFVWTYQLGGNMMASNAIVSVDFVLHGVQSDSIRITCPDLSRVNSVSESAKVTNTSYEYSGRHDHGELPKLKTDGKHALLVAALQDAKRECDRILTQKINEEYGYDNADTKMELDAGEDEEVSEKKAKKQCVGKHASHP
jgi:hypothetical protein